MAMVAFSCFVIVGNNPFAITAIEKRVLQAVRAFIRSLWQAPYLDLNDSAAIQHDLLVLKQNSIHMLIIAYAA